MWQQVHDELRETGLQMIAIALDRSADDVRPWVEAGNVTYPVLIDSDHVVADRYRIINVPTSVWIDEQGRIVRPCDAAFGNDNFIDMTGIPSGPHMEGLKAWARTGALPFTPDEIRDRQVAPTPDEQLARAEFGLAWWLHRHGKPEAAERHFQRADQLAPHDFTIRRGSMPIRGKDPFGADFAEVFSEWVAKGRPFYEAMRPK